MDKTLIETQRRIVTLCGSTKFEEEYRKANSELTKAGIIVLSVGTFVRKEYHDENNPESIELKRKLDRLHMDKIEISDSILVLNKNKYLGSSTWNEIEYARKNNKKVYWLEKPYWSIQLLHEYVENTHLGIKSFLEVDKR